MKFKSYKSILRQHKISHREFADYVGYSRERMTLLLNGASLGSKKEAWLIEQANKLIQSKAPKLTNLPKENT